MPIENDNGENNDSEAIQALKSRLSHFETETGRLSGLSYTPKTPTEVIITSSPKAGTTWLQQICHQIRSGPNGEMSFSEISEVVPWLELAYDQNQNLNDVQYGDEKGSPRLFKTHAWYPHCPKGAKHICIVRDPIDVALSFYNFFENWFFAPGEISITAFVTEFWLARGRPTSRMTNASFFDHFLSWWDVKEEESVLFLFFEDLKEDLGGVVRRIAEFMSTSEHDFNRDDIIEGAIHRSSFEFMMEHKSQFDEKLSKIARNEACGLAKDAGMTSTKLKRGESGLGKKELPEDIVMAIRERWRRQMEPVTGFATYAELRASVSPHVKGKV